MTKKKRTIFFKTKYFGLFIGFVFALFFSFAGIFFNFFLNTESKVLDTYFNLKSRTTKTAVQKGVWFSEENKNVSPAIQIIGVDLKSLQKFGAWPFSRSIHASLINSFNRITNQNEREKALFLDFFFIDDYEDSISDAILAKSINDSGKVFLETILDASSFNDEIDEDMFNRQNFLFSKTNQIGLVQGNWKDLRPYFGLQTNLSLFNSVVKGYGSANLTPDYSDEVIRKQPLFLKYSQLLECVAFEDLSVDFEIDESRFQRLCWLDSKGIEHQINLPLNEADLHRLELHIYKNAPPLYDPYGTGDYTQETRVIELYQDYFIPSIAFSLALEHWGVGLESCELHIGKEIIVHLDKTKTISIPIDDQCQMFINFAGKPSSSATSEYRTFPVYSYVGYAVDTPENLNFWPETMGVKDKIVMVGAFDKGMADDEKLTPYGMMFGIEIHANSVNTLITENFITKPHRAIQFLLPFFIIFIVSLLASKMKNLWSIPVVLVFMLSTFISYSLIFDLYSIVFNYYVPLLGSLLTYVIIVLYRASTEEREQRKIKAMFGKYVSPDVVAQMIDNPPELGGVDKELTVFFSDIRGFTSLSETLSPQELVKHLNEYLSAMTDIILETSGTLDKYVGDEIMCFWGAPLEVKDHAYKACCCALLQIKKLAELNSRWPKERQISIGIGINTGIMTVGNMGSKGRMNYTLMGDNVNLGARLEGTNKVYGTTIIVSEATYALVKDQFIFRELDTIRVKGKNRPVVMYELLDFIE